MLSAGLKHKNLGVLEWLLMVCVLALVLLFLPFSIWFCVKVGTISQFQSIKQTLNTRLYYKKLVPQQQLFKRYKGLIRVISFFQNIGD